MSLPMREILRVADVKPAGDFLLELTFSDGTTKRVNVEPLLWGPVFEPLRDPKEFAKVYVDEILETVAWPAAPTSRRNLYLSSQTWN